MTMDEIKARHEVAGGRFFIGMMAFYGLTIEDFDVSFDTGTYWVSFRLIDSRGIFGLPRMVYMFEPSTGVIDEQVSA